jgi:DNA-nicking Smr family endonuclease
MSTKKSPHEPLAASPFKKDLKALKDQLVADEERRQAAQKARDEAAKARGDRVPKRPATPAATAPKRSSTVEVWRPNMDARLFEVAMSGVAPLAPKAGGRVPERGPEVARTKRAAPEVKERQRRAEGGPEVPVQWAADGTVRGAHRGREFALEALGRFAMPDETLDLHGLEPVPAALRVAEFVRSRRARGLRCLCVVTGYGKNSPDGASVLLDAVVNTLRAAPAAGDVDAFASAPEGLGGRGALLISLRH